MSFATTATALPHRTRARQPVSAVAFPPIDFAPMPVDDDIDMRQLRHHTKNALQRILCLIAQTPGLCDTAAGEQMARELENRIALSAAISDSLFGLTRAPGSISDRLRTLGESVVQMMSRPGQIVALDVSVRGVCPPHLHETLLRVAHELLGNAMKHGMKGRPEGRIAIRLEHHPKFRRTRLTITDDGNGFAGQPADGEGMSVARSLADRHNGTLRLWCENGTVAMLDLPTVPVRAH